MGTRDRVLRIGPPVLGLTDYPEHAKPESATIALNVEYRYGGVSTRRGTARLVGNAYTDPIGGAARPCTVKLVKSFRDTFGGELVAIGLVPGGEASGGSEAGNEILQVRWLSTGAIVGAPAGSLTLLGGAVGDLSPKKRWDACQFQQLHRTHANLIVCTNAQSVHTGAKIVGFDGGINEEGDPGGGILAINRRLTPYHGDGGQVPGSPYTDDYGDYITGPMSAQYCRTLAGRLFLANLNLSQKMPIKNEASALIYSNFTDAAGWPLDNIHVPFAGDQAPITGLGNWGQYIAVFREASVSLINVQGEGAGLKPWYQQIVTGIGCVAHSTIVENVKGMLCFLAADNFYGFKGDGEPVKLSGPIERTLQAAINQGDVGACWATHYQNASQVWLGVPSGSAHPDRVFVMDYSQSPPAWSEFQFQAAAWVDGGQRLRWGGACASPDGTRIFSVVKRAAGTVDYDQADIGDAIDQQGGAPTGFRSRWESGPIQYGQANVMDWRFIRPTIRPQGAINATMWWRKDGLAFEAGAKNQQSATVSMSAQDTGVALGAFVLGTDRLGPGEDHTERKVDVYAGGRGRYGRLGIETAGALSEKFDVHDVEIDVIDPGVRR